MSTQRDLAQKAGVGKTVNVYLIGIIGAMAGLLFGFDTGVISGAQEFIFHSFSIKAETLMGLVVSAVPIGALMGALLSGYFAKVLGRRRSIRMTALLFLVGTLGAAMAPSIQFVLLGRFIMGVAIGISAMVVPMYLGEVSPAKKRGTIIFLFQLAITLGLLTAFAVNLCFAQWITEKETTWRWMFAVGVLPAVLLYVGMGRMPLSPRWLMLRGKKAQAQTVMESLIGRNCASKAMEEMEESMRHEGGSHWGYLFKKPILPLVIVSFGLFVFQQLSGINAIMYYGPKVFANAGFGEKAKFLAQFLMGMTNVLATILGVWIVDKLGRRTLLFIGFTGMVLCLSVIAFCLNAGGSYAYLALGSTLLYVLFFAISLGGVPYIMMSEVFPLKVRSSGMAIASCANWSFNILVSFTFGILVNLMGGMSQVFILYAFCTIVGFLFAWKFVPETRGKHLEELEHNLYKGKPLRNLGDPIPVGISDTALSANAPAGEVAGQPTMGARIGSEENAEVV